MAASYQEISSNIVQGSSELPVEQVAAFDSSDFMHGGRYATLITPEFAAVYREGVVHVMGGIVVQSVEETPLPRGGTTRASIFGFKDVDFITTTGQSTRLLVPSIHRAFLPMVGDDPNDALHGYHVRLIDSTNNALDALGSPYRLATL